MAEVPMLRKRKKPKAKKKALPGHLSPMTMTPGQRELVARIAMLPEGERLELVRYLMARVGIGGSS
jgi:hypothetical protein